MKKEIRRPGKSIEITWKLLMSAGVHFGASVEDCNPNMRSYIHKERNGVHIIDLSQTMAQLKKACDVVRATVASKGRVLFVGTKPQARETVSRSANRCGMPYIIDEATEDLPRFKKGGLPNLLFVVDVRIDQAFIRKANRYGIPVIALVDTDCDPTGIDYVIPANDDAARSVKVLSKGIAAAVQEGRALRKCYRLR